MPAINYTAEYVYFHKKSNILSLQYSNISLITQANKKTAYSRREIGFIFHTQNGFRNNITYLSACIFSHTVVDYKYFNAFQSPRGKNLNGYVVS